MCDYSLMSFPNRLARDGDELIVHRFQGGAKGLASVSDLQQAAIPFPVQRSRFQSILNKIGSLWMGSAAAPNQARTVPAVCIPPGTRLLLREIPERLQSELGVHRVEEATFTQITAASFADRDAVHFRNGREIILQLVPEGQRVRVLNTSSTETAGPRLDLLAPVS
jgi:hypothetical protein